MDVPVQAVIFFILIQFIFVSEVQGKWVSIEREELLDTYYEQGKIFNHLYNVCTLVNLEMSLSWNFPPRASPSYEGAEPSQAKLGHFNFRAEPELKFFLNPN